MPGFPFGSLSSTQIVLLQLSRDRATSGDLGVGPGNVFKGPVVRSYVSFPGELRMGLCPETRSYASTPSAEHVGGSRWFPGGWPAQGPVPRIKPGASTERFQGVHCIISSTEDQFDCHVQHPYSQSLYILYIGTFIHYIYLMERAEMLQSVR